METSLFMICVSSFVGVFIVLVFLAVAMELITRIFPQKIVRTGSDDAAIFAAITSSYSRLYPGRQISNIEEIKNCMK